MSTSTKTGVSKKTSFSTKGQRADIGHLVIYRILPNRYTDAVGPFVFLDYLARQTQISIQERGMGVHPHRGIATLSYILEGEAAHFDSVGNHEMVYSGGVQWMKSGHGILHDETLNADANIGGNQTQGFQFWINLPAKNKAEKPEYLAIQSNEVPRKELPDDAGWVKVIVGAYEDLKATIPNYSEQFLYHIRLSSQKSFTLSIPESTEIAAFLPEANVIVNGVEFDAGEFIEFDRKAGDIAIKNHLEEGADILLFGGEPYTEPIVAEGPFVMNSQAEIAQAYRDFYAGNYGEINQQKGKV